MENDHLNQRIIDLVQEIAADLNALEKSTKQKHPLFLLLFFPFCIAAGIGCAVLILHYLK